MPFLSRRRVLAGGAAAGLGAAGVALGVELEVLPGRSWAYHRLRLDGADGVIPDLDPGEVVTGSLASRARGVDCGWTVALPPGVEAAGLPVAVILHGSGDDHTSPFGSDGLGYERFLADAVGHGTPPFALASVDGGEAFWHDLDGDRAASMVIEEFLPLLGERGLDTSGIGLMGWSMGGFGALHIGGILGRQRVRAVAAISPALARGYSEEYDHHFDGEDDFAEATPFGRQDDLDGIAVRIDCGEGDSRYAATREYVDGFDTPPAGGFQWGDHDRGYWLRMAPDQMRFLGEHL